MSLLIYIKIAITLMAGKMPAPRLKIAMLLLLLKTADGLCILGTTPTGRARCDRLDLNDERSEEKFIQKSR